jgi:hypothetical protein
MEEWKQKSGSRRVEARNGSVAFLNPWKLDSMEYMEDWKK